jgi:hypothetical protein
MIDRALLERLRSITDFSELKIFLTDELGWPLADYEFEDLTFEYSPEEIGLDEKNAAKIQSIRRMRSLSVDQPWGIFFVEFEKKNLPVEALRRILSHVAIRGRNSRTKKDQQRWNVDDLLFISNIGTSVQRSISLAHFSSPKITGSLPVLKVVSWDSSDAVLHLDEVLSGLRVNLSWPDDETDINSWRENWTAAFTLKHKEVISTSQVLASRLASLARETRNRIVRLLELEIDSGPLHLLFKDFKKALIHDLDESSFADMYAQTLAYGLLATRLASPSNNLVGDFDIEINTSSFIHELMSSLLHAAGKNSGETIHGRLDFDELGVNEVVDLLNVSNLDSILRNFGDRRKEEDPVVHFYEDFLKEYDPNQRIERGVFYTPRSVVRYIVTGAHRMLKSEFGLEHGLADTSSWEEVAARIEGLNIPDGLDPASPFVNVLDPALGTGTFLVEVIDVIEEELKTRWRISGNSPNEIKELWIDYVDRYLLRRLNGFEIMMAPFVISHLKLGLRLFESGYKFSSKTQINIHLTNALEEAENQNNQLEGISPILATEVRLTNEAKEHGVFTVIVGNPPYSSISRNKNKFIDLAVGRYSETDEGPIKERSNRNHLQDDYVKFIALCHVALEKSGAGVLTLISNSSFLSGAWTRGMRYQLVKSFNRIEIMDLHGGKGFIRSTSDDDENVFDIMQSVAISTFVKSRLENCHIQYSEIIGSREKKFADLSSYQSHQAPSSPVNPETGNQWSFRPFNDEGKSEWSQFISLEEVFREWGDGAKTNRDGLAVAFTRDELNRKILDFANLEISDSEIEEAYRFGSNYQWKTQSVRQRFAATKLQQEDVKRYAYRPFDVRYVFWHSDIVFNRRGRKLDSLASNNDNLGLLFSRTTTKDSYSNIFVCDAIPDMQILFNTKVAPLFGQADESKLFEEESCNLSDFFVSRIGDAIGRNSSQVLTPNSIFQYIYAVLYSPAYRSKYIEFLRMEIPRIPLPSSVEVFSELSNLGSQLIDLHLLRGDFSNDESKISLLTSELPLVGKIQRHENTVFIGTTKTEKSMAERGLGLVSEVSDEVWNFEIGGHQVAQKWLKDRKGRPLSQIDCEQYLAILKAIERTVAVMGSIDHFIEEQGGWPAVFVS